MEAGHNPGSGLSQFSIADGNEGSSADYGDRNHEEDEQRLQAQRELQMLDLGTGRREYVTTHDKPIPRELRLSKQQLLDARKVNEEGTNAARWYQQNQDALTAWNNIGSEIANHNGDREQLADLMEGQSHRARLNKEIKELGGQEYGELSTGGVEDHMRLGKGVGVLARGIPGRSGRGAPMRVPLSKAAGGVSAVAPPPIHTAPKANRPLDPAIDPNREYGYKGRRGGKPSTVSYSGGPAVRDGQALGRGKARNDARATMVGSTVRIGLSASRSNPRRPEPPWDSHQAPVTMALNDQAFLKVLTNMKTKPAFNAHVPANSKPAPASKAAALVEKPAKRDQKPAPGLPKSAETPTEAFKNLEAWGPSNSANRDIGSIRLAPTHEFAFPPPITRSLQKRTQSSNVSVHTDGVESAATFDSAEFGTQSSRGVKSGLDQNPATIVMASDTVERKGETGCVGQPATNDLGINVLQPAREAESEHNDDLIMLDQETGLSQAVSKINSDDAAAASNGISVRSPSVPDIMDEEVDIDIPQTSLTPKPAVAPRSITYRGVRYIRADQLMARDLETLLHATRPAPQTACSDEDICNRVPVTSGVSIGLRTLRANSDGSILGEHNLPGRSRGDKESSSTMRPRASNPTTEDTKPAAPEVNRHQSSSSQTHVKPEAPLPTRQHCYVIPEADRADREINDASPASLEGQKAAPASNLAASKYATPGAHVMTGQIMTGATANFRQAPASSSTGRVSKETGASSATPSTLQDKMVPMSKGPNDKKNLPTLYWSKTEGLHDKENGAQADMNAISEPEHILRARNSSGWNGGEDADDGFDAVNVSHNKGHRRRNPFDNGTLTSKPTVTEENNIVQSMALPVITERAGNIPTTGIPPLTTGERLVGPMNSGSQVGLSASRFIVPAQSVHAPVKDGFVADMPVSSRTPATMDETLVQAMRSGQQVGLSGIPKLAASGPSTRGDSTRENFAVEDQDSRSGILESKPNPTTSLMASRYAATNPPVRSRHATKVSNRQKRSYQVGSSSDESEIEAS